MPHVGTRTSTRAGLTDALQRLAGRRFHTTLPGDAGPLRDHLVHEVPVLPGVFLLDVALRTVRQSGVEPAGTELRRCLFPAPITAPAGCDHHLRVAVDGPGDDDTEQEAGEAAPALRLRVSSRPLSADGAPVGEWTVNLRCEVHPRGQALPALPHRPADPHDPGQDAAELYAFARRVGIRHQDFMRPAGRLRRTAAGGAVATAELAPSAHGALPDFFVHPVLLDFATLVPFWLFEAEQRQAATQPFIPLYVETVRADRPLPATCRVVVPEPPRGGLGEETIGADLFLAGQGEETAALALLGFRAKRIRSADHIGRSADRTARAATAPTAARAGADTAQPPVSPASAAADEAPDGDLADSIARLVGERLDTSATELDRDRGFYELGLNSVDLLGIGERLEELLGHRLYPTLLFEQPTIRRLATHLDAEFGQATAAALASDRRDGPDSHPLTHVPTIPVTPDRATAVPVPDADAIAVVGVAGRFPGARDLREFWGVLREGRDCVTEVPADRWDWRDHFDPDPGTLGRTYGRWGGFIGGVDEFDPLFFAISPRDAGMMDPQERLFLQTAWATLEDAGYPPARLRDATGGAVGVFAGAMWSDYQLFGHEQQLRGNPQVAGSWFSSIPNRVSFALDLTGPSVAVDTACSSSLHAVHLACESIRQGECRAALAGGVNLSLHPSKYLKLAELRMLSTDGRCRAFGEGGDGYVPGEGVGAVLLRPLADAIAAGDHIHAVIRGSAAGHGGRTGGFSVPNPEAQARLVLAAQERAGVPAGTVTYVEAHGTGTALGDPIEIAGLTTAFRKVTESRGYCAVGSVKSNIGHLEAAAGIAALAKVLLCLRHGELVPTLHADRPNTRIDFADSPFRLTDRVEQWHRLTDPATGRPVPRRAGISAFGAGGDNVHLVVEEYQPAQQQGADARADEHDTDEAVVPLSARDAERLRELVTGLADFLRAEPAVRLADVAHTFQTGREAMGSRLALVVRSRDQLIDALDDHAAGRTPRAPHRFGQVRKGASRATGSSTGPEAPPLERLAAEWAAGHEVRWESEEASETAAPGRRVPLPTYPFARRRCWIAEEPGTRREPDALGLRLRAVPADDGAAGPRVSVVIRGDEPWLRDHELRGRALVPGAVQLALVREAARLAKVCEPAGPAGTPAVERFRWLAPLYAPDADITPTGTVVVISFAARDGGHDVELTTGAPDTPTVHATGRLAPTGHAAPVDAEPAVPVETLDAEEVYGRLAGRGWRYGPTLRLVRRVRIGAAAALAELAADGETPVDVALLLDGAFQALIGLLKGPGAALPFQAEHVTLVSGPVTGRCLAHLVRSPGADDANDAFGIRITDADGTTLAAIDRLTLRAPADRTLRYAPVWTSATAVPARPPDTLLVLDEDEERIAALRSRGAHVVTVRRGDRYARLGRDRYQISPQSDTDYTELLAALSADGVRPNGVLHLWHLSDSPGTAGGDAGLPAGDSFESAFLLCRSLVSAAGPGMAVVFASAVTAQAPGHAALGGLARTVRLEQPKLRVRSVWFGDAHPAAPDVQADRLLAEIAATDGDTEIQYAADGARRVRGYRRLPPTPPDSCGPPLVRAGGSYVVTGGGGGLGLLVAGDLALRAGPEGGIGIVLMGRSPLDEARAARLDALCGAGADVRYVAGDVTDEAAVREAVALAGRLGTLRGVIHAAGVLDDGLLAGKDLAAFRRVWAPKTAGARLLDLATADAPLDYLLLFGSVAASLGSVGQAGYAAANGFLTGFAQWREERRRRGERVGVTVAIDWPLWREGGMRVPADREAAVLSSSGLTLLETDEGLTALADAVAHDGTSLVVLRGDRRRLEQRLGRVVAEPELQAFGPREPESEAIRETIDREIALILADLLKVAPGELDPDDSLSDYGIDSVVAMQALDRIEQRYGQSFAPSLLTDGASLRELAAHVADSLPPPDTAPGEPRQPAGRARRLPDSTPQADRRPSGTRTAAAPAAGAERPGLPVGTAPASSRRPIAVVAVAGRFPGSPSADAFWDHLAAGRDLVGRVPDGRWEQRWTRAMTPAVADAAGRGGYLADTDRFDGAFFGIGPADAAWMDPQQRLLLETTQHLLDAAGYRPDELAGRQVGVFIGATANDHVRQRFHHGLAPTARLLVSTLPNMIAAGLCHAFDFRGPAHVVDTACSSSLVAVHQACRSLLDGECEAAVVGGVNLLLDPFVHIGVAEAGLLSPDGRTRVFDRDAQGFSLGEGTGLLLLKDAERAYADGDPVLATVLGSAVNNDGRTLGITTPSPDAQVRLLTAALRSAGVSADTIGHLETNGSASPFGDPLEIHAAAQVYRRATDRTQYCAVGSVKSNVGALLHAGGAASLIKSVLALHHRFLPPTLHLTEPHPRIRFTETPFRPVRQGTPWEAEPTRPRRAAVSSFGFGGTNAHLVLEEADPAHRTARQPLPATDFDHGAAERRERRDPLDALLDALDDGALTPDQAARRLTEYR